MQSMMLKCEVGGGDDDMAIPFHQQTFSPLGTFSRELCEPEGLFFFYANKSFIPVKTWRWVLICWLEISPPHSHHQPHLISGKHYSAEKWLTRRCLWSVEVRRDSPWGRNLAVLSRVCHAPQVGTVCFFCRQINNSWIFYDCLLELR